MNHPLEPGQDNFTRAAQRLNTQRPLHKRLQRIVINLHAGRLDLAEREVGEHLARHPGDVDAISLMAETQSRRGFAAEAAVLFARCLDRAPDFAAARFNLAKLLLQLNRFSEALEQVERLLATDARNPLYRQLKANILEIMGDGAQTLAICEELAHENPRRAESWISYGHALRALGHQEQSIAAYRKAIACRPDFGAAYWALANLKTALFNDADIAAMQVQLARADIAQEDRVMLRFSLGKAYEDAGAYERSFEQYARANAATRPRVDYDPDKLTARVAETKALFTPEFVESRTGQGCPATDPIFVLGRPRSGSTLIEQILSSHSAIEGTAELPYVQDIASRLQEVNDGGYPNLLAKLAVSKLKALGEEYLERARVHRKLGRPFFIDKEPANFSHLGLILLILPNAKVIDARRHPAAACLSSFKHYRSKGGLRLAELGRFYRDYLEYMEHFARLLPGRIHRVIYESMVADPESETRRLISYLGLPFEESCLRFYETKRTVLTPSSEQVRRPISSEAVNHWRNFEPWLGPLLRELGSAFTEYPDVLGKAL